MHSSDGEPAASLFHPPPSEPDLQRFRVSGSPVDLFDGLVGLRVGCPAWIATWHCLQTTNVFRFRAAILSIQFGSFLSSFHVEVCEFPDVMDLDLLPGTAEFARIRQESGISSARGGGVRSWSVSRSSMYTSGSVVNRMPPNRAINGSLPSRSSFTSRHLRIRP